MVGTASQGVGLVANYKTVCLKDICIFEKGVTGLANAVPGEYPLVATGAERRTSESFQLDTKAVCIPLVSSTGHGHASLKNVHYQEGKFALGTILVALTAIDDNELDIQFLHLYLFQLKNIILVPLMSGAANVALSVTKIKNVEIPLPSIERQKEIVVQFKSIVIEEAELKNELTYQQSLLKKLRQQILQEAIEGKLTVEFRIKNEELRKQYEQELAQADDPETIRHLKLKIRNCSESAASLLSRIKAEKEQLIKDKKIKNQKALPPITDEEKPFDLPDGWEWTRIGDITNMVTSGSRNWKSYYSESGSSFIRSQDIKLDRLQYANRAFVKVSKGAEGSRTSVNQGDWLITITGGNVGKCAYLDDNPGDAYVSQHVGLMRPTIKEMGQFGHAWLTAEHGGRGLLSNFIYGDKPGLNLLQLRSLLFPLPSINEQQAIVIKIESLLAICDQLEAQLTDNQTHAEQLMQAVLKEAFQQDETSLC